MPQLFAVMRTRGPAWDDSVAMEGQVAFKVAADALDQAWRLRLGTVVGTPGSTWAP